MELTAYQQEILIWLYGLQNYQGIFANVPPPPPGIVPPLVSQAPDGEAWIAVETTASLPPPVPEAIPDIPGTAENDPQVAIAAMPELVAQHGGTLLLTLDGAHAVEGLAREGRWPVLAEEALANINARLAILESASGPKVTAGAPPACEAMEDPRWNTNAALLARAGLIT